MTELQRQAIEMLARGVSVSGTARALGIDRSTLTRWRQNSSFVGATDERRVALERDGEAPVADDEPRAVLRSVMMDPSASHAARVNAAVSLARLDERGVMTEVSTAQLPEFADKAEMCAVIARGFKAAARSADDPQMQAVLRSAAEDALRIFDS